MKGWRDTLMYHNDDWIPDCMTFLQFLHLSAIGLSFAVWTWFMFKLLFQLADRSLLQNAHAGGGYLGWVRQSFQTLGQIMTSKQDRRMRRQVIWPLLILIGLTALTPVVASLGRSF